MREIPIQYIGIYFKVFYEHSHCTLPQKNMVAIIHTVVSIKRVALMSKPEVDSKLRKPFHIKWKFISYGKKHKF